MTGPDGKSYRVDTYIRTATVDSGRTGKRVTVVVRRTDTLSVAALARLSAFDLGTGCIPNSSCPC